MAHELDQIIEIMQRLDAAKVANFSYTEQALLDNDIEGVLSFNEDNAQNVPVKEKTDIEDTVRNYGLRAQGGSLPRQSINHFFGRSSYNLNKLTEKVLAFFAITKAKFRRDATRYEEEFTYSQGDICFTASTTGTITTVTYYVCLMNNTTGITPGTDSLRWKQISLNLSESRALFSGKGFVPVYTQIDLTSASYDVDTWYPYVMDVAPIIDTLNNTGRLKSVIDVYGERSGGKAYLSVDTVISRNETFDTDVLHANSAITSTGSIQNPSPIGYSRLVNGGQRVVWLRGGARYLVYNSTGLDFTLHTSTYDNGVDDPISPSGSIVYLPNYRRVFLKAVVPEALYSDEAVNLGQVQDMVTSGVVTNAVLLSGNQNVDGVKTFLQAMHIQPGTDTTNPVRADRTITAGDGLTGGGNLTANRSFAVDSSVVRTSRAISAGDGLTGGGDLTANVSLAVDSSVVRTTRSISAGDGLTGGGTLAASRTLSVDSTVVRTTRAVNTGSGLTGGGTLAANRTLSVDSTVVRTSGSQTIGGEKTFSSSPLVPTPSPGSNNQYVANTNWVRTLISSAVYAVKRMLFSGFIPDNTVRVRLNALANHSRYTSQLYNGKIYLPQSGGTAMEVYDCATGTVQTYNVLSAGHSRTTSQLYNGKIYLPESGGTAMEVYDCATNTVQTYNVLSADHYRFTSQLYNGKIYLPRSGSTSMQVYDCATNTVQTYNVLANYDRFTSQLYNGKIYLPQHNGTNMQVYDCATNTVKTYNVLADYNSRFTSQLYNGKIYLPRSSGTVMQVYDCTTNTAQTYNVLASNGRETSQLYDGKIYLPESGGTAMQVYDCATNTVQTYNVLANHTRRTSQLYNGKIYLPQSSGTNMQVYNIYKPDLALQVTDNVNTGAGIVETGVSEDGKHRYRKFSDGTVIATGKDTVSIAGIRMPIKKITTVNDGTSRTCTYGDGKIYLPKGTTLYTIDGTTLEVVHTHTIPNIGISHSCHFYKGKVFIDIGASMIVYDTVSKTHTTVGKSSYALLSTSKLLGNKIIGAGTNENTAFIYNCDDSSYIETDPIFANSTQKYTSFVLNEKVYILQTGSSSYYYIVEVSQDGTVRTAGTTTKTVGSIYSLLKNEKAFFPGNNFMGVLYAIGDTFVVSEYTSTGQSFIGTYPFTIGNSIFYITNNGLVSIIDINTGTVTAYNVSFIPVASGDYIYACPELDDVVCIPISGASEVYFVGRGEKTVVIPREYIAIQSIESIESISFSASYNTLYAHDVKPPTVSYTYDKEGNIIASIKIDESLARSDVTLTYQIIGRE